MIKLVELLQENKDTKDSVGLLLIHDKKLLCMKRTASYWSIPKGHVQEHEDWGYFEFSKLPAGFDEKLIAMKNDWYSQKLLEPHSNYQRDNQDVPV